MIKPTVGRHVDFWPGPSYQGRRHDGTKPLCAHIAHVWNDRLINVVTWDSNGVQWSVTSVQLLQDDDAKPEGQSFATWMGYQVEQAVKHAEPKSDPLGR